MAFNIVARNQDDHVKNIAFLMNKSGEWSLSPAFDMTYSFNPSGAWTASHQMTMNGKRDNFTLEDFNACAKTASMKRGRAQKSSPRCRRQYRNGSRSELVRIFVCKAYSTVRERNEKCPSNKPNPRS